MNRKITVAEKTVVEKTKKIQPVKDIKEIKKVKMATLSERIKDKKKEQKREREETARKLAKIRSDTKKNAKKETEDVSSEVSNPYEGMGSNDAYLLYVDLIRQRIWSYWKSPKVDVEGLSVIVEIKFTKDWRIDKYIPNEISNNKLYDQSVFKAVLMAQESSKVSPFPPPPSDYEQDALDGIVITFSP
ncbi:MAG: TonB C-terminal domain-containing protein [Thermodesulfovibrionia bacterium]|nr:TonB C-terminal domain-containing protein [Thermodesulfovibrionia bacterium]